MAGFWIAVVAVDDMSRLGKLRERAVMALTLAEITVLPRPPAVRAVVRERPCLMAREIIVSISLYF
jgi:hypothetical protein